MNGAVNTRVLVTGASGFTGSHLAHLLADEGYEVRALVRPNADVSALDAAHIQSGAIQLVEGDLLHHKTIERAIAGCRHVYHVAALYRAAKHPDQMYWDVNVGGTNAVIEACQQHGVERFLHCSTIGVHGGVDTIPADEQAPFAPSDIYQQTKLAAEQDVRTAHASGLPITIVRPAGIYGPGDLRFLKLFTLVKSGRFIMFGSGETFLHLVFVEDLVRGMLLAVEHPGGLGATMILAGEEYVSLNQLVRLVAQATNATTPRWRFPLWPLMTAAAGCEWLCRPLGIEPPLHRRRAAFFSKNRAFSIEHAQQAIGFAPQISLPEGLQRTADWYTSKNLLA